MELIPPGYKQTGIGLLPVEWRVEQLGKCLLTPPAYGINAPAVPYADNLPPYIRITDITDEGRFAPEKPVCVNHPNSSNYLLEDGDLVLARTGASVGKSYKYTSTDGPLVFAGFLIRARANKQVLLPDFLRAYLQTTHYWQWVNVMSMRSGQPGINGAEYASLPIPLPPIEEQTAITGAFRDVDALIAKLDRLAAKKSDIKKGAMQELLTGKRRLPGFTEDWKIFGFSDVFNRVNSKQFQIQANKYESFGNYRVIDQGKNVIAGYSDNAVCLFNCPSSGVVVFGDHTRIVKFIDFDFVIGADGTQVLRVQDGHFTKFMYFQLVEKEIPNTGYNRHYKFLKEMSFVAPEYEEQVAIAAVLSDMEAEISELKAKRAKMADIKQGMMQQLLTGKIRLV